MLQKGVNEIRSAWKNVNRENSFGRNVAFTFSGNAIAIVLGFAFTPVLTRIYSPEAYGVFSFFIAVGQNIGNVATLQLTRAFVLPRDHQTFRNLFVISLISSTVLSLLALIAFYFFGDEILAFFDAEGLAPFVLLIPLTILLSALSDMVRTWSVRSKEFKRAGYVKVGSTLASRTGAIVIGLVATGSVVGLLLSEILYKLVDIIFLTGNKIRQFFEQPHDGQATLGNTFRQYKAYPMYVLPATWTGNLTTQLPVYFLLAAFSTEVVGHYSLANRMLNIPAMIVITSLAPVFLQRVSEQYRDAPDQIADMLGKLVNWLLAVTLVPFLLLMIFSESIFLIFLGDQWRLAGQCAFFLASYYPFYILGASMVSLFRIFGRERLSFLFNAAQAGLVALALWLGVNSGDLFYTLGIYGLTSVVLNAVQTIILLRIARYKHIGRLLVIMGVFLAVTVALAFLKYMPA